MKRIVDTVVLLLVIHNALYNQMTKKRKNVFSSKKDKPKSKRVRRQKSLGCFTLRKPGKDFFVLEKEKGCSAGVDFSSVELENVTMIGGGKNHIIVICCERDLFSIHCWTKITGFWFQQSKQWNYHHYTANSKPLSITSGDENSVITLQSGEVCIFQNEYDTKFLFQTQLAQEQIIQVACGKLHTIFLTKNKDKYCIWSCGYGLCGQTGCSSENGEWFHSLKKVVDVKKEIVYIACGEYCSLYVTIDDQVFVCGSHHELNIGNKNGFLLHQRIDLKKLRGWEQLFIHHKMLLVKRAGDFYVFNTKSDTYEIFYPCPELTRNEMGGFYCFTHTPTILFWKGRSLHMWGGQNVNDYLLGDTIRFNLPASKIINGVHMTESCIFVHVADVIVALPEVLHSAKTNFHDVEFLF